MPLVQGVAHRAMEARCRTGSRIVTGMSTNMGGDLSTRILSLSLISVRATSVELKLVSVGVS